MKEEHKKKEILDVIDMGNMTGDRANEKNWKTQ